VANPQGPAWSGPSAAETLASGGRQRGRRGQTLIIGDVADDFAERYVSWFSAGVARRPAGPRSVGVELEYPVVDEHGHPAEPTRVIGAAARFGTSVTTEMGCSTLEARVGPVSDLHMLDKRVTDLVTELSAMLGADGCRLLGYGVQPIAGIADLLLSPGERYRQLHDGSMPADGGARWGGLLCLSASSQVHVDVSVAEAASVAGALNRTAALRIALMANSPWSARLPGAGQARRELFWDRAFANRPRRWGILPPSETLADHARRLLATDAFLASRNGGVLRIEEPVSWVELLRSERPVAAWDVDGARHRLQPRVTDPLEHLGAIWSCTRLSPDYGTVEDRVACAQPPGEQTANAALVLGLVERTEELCELADALPLEWWVDARVDACCRGLSAQVGTVPVVSLVEKMLAIAERGLSARGLAEDRYLDPLRERLARGENPATRLLAVPVADRLPWLLEQAAL
jgi:gamma-glutamylcysteine synthetase